MSINSSQWSYDQIKSVKIREADSGEIEEYEKGRLQESYVTWFSRGLERTVNAIHLYATGNIKANYELSIGKDPFLSPHYNWFMPDAFIVDHPSVLSALIKKHRNDPNGIFQIKDNGMVESLIKEMFDDSEVEKEDLLFFGATPKTTKKFHSFFAKFFTKKNLQEHLPSIEKCVEETIKNWGVLGEINLSVQTRLFACRIMARLFLGSEEKTVQIVDAIKIYSYYLSAKFRRKSFDLEKLAFARQTFKDIANEAMKEKAEEGKPNNLVQAMVEDPTFSEKDIRLTVFHLFFAGVTNSDTGLAYPIFKCAQDGGLQDNIRKDKSAIGKSLAKALRIFPPAYKVLRTTAKHTVLEVKNNDDEVATRFIPENSRLELMISAAAKHYEFSDDLMSDSFAKLPWQPFGRGAHSCPGSNLFEAEAELLMEKLFENYKLTTDSHEEPLQIGTAFNRPYNDLYVKLELISQDRI